MARKDLLKGLMGQPEESAKPDKAPAPRPSYSKGAIGAVSRSISELKSRSIIEVSADLIEDTGGLRDRLDENADDDGALLESLRTYGQQVPVLLRHDPNKEGRYQIVYGRRRVAALRALGTPVKALMRVLNDQDLIIAQGQENSARRDLTFIEKANFARQMRDARFERRLICDALHIDKTVISRMLNVADTVTEPVIRAIGSAPGVGRDRWLRLVALIEAGNIAPHTLLRQIPDTRSLSSDARFDAALTLAAGDKPAKPKSNLPVALQADGRDVGQIKRGATSVTLTLKDPEFGDWLADHITEFHRTWAKTRDGE